MAAGTILIAGATGYLGSRLAHRFADGGRRVVAAVRPTSRLDRLGGRFKTVDLTASDYELRQQLERFGVGTIVNCIADYGRGGASRSRVTGANLLTPLRLLEAGYETGVATFLNAHTSLPHDVNAYTLAKHQFTDWLAGATVPATRINVTLEQFYGPADPRENFLARLVGDLLDGADEIRTTPAEQLRDLVHVDDAVDAFETLLRESAELGPGFHEFPVGTGRPASLKDVIETARRLSGNARTRVAYGARPYRDNEVMHTAADVRPMATLGWEAKIGLEEGLAAVIEAGREGRQVSRAA